MAGLWQRLTRKTTRGVSFYVLAQLGALVQLFGVPYWLLDSGLESSLGGEVFFPIVIFNTLVSLIALKICSDLGWLIDGENKRILAERAAAERSSRTLDTPDHDLQ
jgi:hypothetical protein